jgi:alpha-ribazole phosphatase
MDLILIRHPAVAVPAGVCYGRSDVPLAADPQAEVQRCLSRLQALGLHGPVTALHASPLARCSAIAEPLAGHFRVALRRDARLREIDFGRWEMQPWDAIARPEIDAWAQDLENARSHGGESVAMLALRVRAWLDELELAQRLALPAPAADMGGGGQAPVGPEAAAGAVVVVTHAGVMRVMASLALRLPLAACVDWQVAAGGLCQLRYNAWQQSWTLVTWNGA